MGRRGLYRGNEAWPGHADAFVLARISHTLSAADADCGASASLRSFGLLDVGSTTPSSASLRAPRIRATLCVLATRGCEKCGLGKVELWCHQGPTTARSRRSRLRLPSSGD